MHSASVQVGRVDYGLPMSTIPQSLNLIRMQATSLLRDYAELVKLRVTALIVMTAWCGYFFGTHKTGVSSLVWGLLHQLEGFGLVAVGTAALIQLRIGELVSQL